MSLPPSPSEQPTPLDILKLDVGGIKFTTSYSIVRNIDGMLSAMFSGLHTLAPDAEGYHFIDRDGTHFSHILNLLRFPTEFSLIELLNVDEPRSAFVLLNERDLDELEQEVDYYGLSEAYTLARVRRTPAITATSLNSRNYNFRWDDRAAAFFTVGDKVLPCPSHVRWNVLLYDPIELKVTSQTAYNTFCDENEEQRLGTFLNAVPKGTIVAISVLLNRGCYDSRLCAALQSLGCTRMYLGPRASYAMVGQKGWPVLAVEAYDKGGTLVTATRPAGTYKKW